MTFSFEKDGIVYMVHTKVGDGPTVIHVREVRPEDEKPQGSSEEKS